jgi:hypothetical protein
MTTVSCEFFCRRSVGVFCLELLQFRALEVNREYALFLEEYQGN